MTLAIELVDVPPVRFEAELAELSAAAPPVGVTLRPCAAVRRHLSARPVSVEESRCPLAGEGPCPDDTSACPEC